MRGRRWRSLAATLAYFNAAFNLLLGSAVLAGVWLVVGVLWTAVIMTGRRRLQASTQRHSFLFGGPVVRSRTVMLGPGESLTALPDGWSRLETARGTRYVRECSHWPRDEVKLNDGTTVAYICRRCGHDWADEEWVMTKDVEW